MASHNDNETLDAPAQRGGEDKTMSSNNRIDIALTATMNGKDRIDISGPSGPFPLGVDTGAWHFDFALNDTTGKGVRFTTLDAEDNRNTCPPTVAGNSSKLIVGDHVEPSDPTKARFIDNNNNRAKDGVVDVSFQWNFECDDESIKHIGTYDPVVPNGGRT
jgi:hypothetical protein